MLREPLSNPKQSPICVVPMRLKIAAALEGLLHLIFAQKLSKPAEVARINSFRGHGSSLILSIISVLV
jgi:hypothetical protein